MARRWVRLVLFIVVCLATLFACFFVHILRPFAHASTHRWRMRITQNWARLLLKILGLQVAYVEPKTSFDAPCLMVCNHQSYLDILIIAAYFPTLFVAKSEVARWPLLGWLASLGGTIFVERKNTLSNVKTVYRVNRELRHGVRVLVFPEGTTSDGTQVLPFHPLFCAAAVRSATPVLPLTIQYVAIHDQRINTETRNVFCWYGEMNFVTHFWRLLDIPSGQACLRIHAPIVTAKQATPLAHNLAMIAHQQITEGFHNAERSFISRPGADTLTHISLRTLPSSGNSPNPFTWLLKTLRAHHRG